MIKKTLIFLISLLIILSFSLSFRSYAAECSVTIKGSYDTALDPKEGSYPTIKINFEQSKHRTKFRTKWKQLEGCTEASVYLEPNDNFTIVCDLTNISCPARKRFQFRVQIEDNGKVQDEAIMWFPSSIEFSEKYEVNFDLGNVAAPFLRGGSISSEGMDDEEKQESDQEPEEAKAVEEETQSDQESEEPQAQE